ncbi:aminotransferase class V-fold PLP-dependent enzyme [Sandarakinorhabdus sp.]|uniref:cysteine desulfurase family protein n=1 Tax=Sandarakinorhabdus sp. TaxID=1916663 RepID=UPI00286DDE5A|nr:aminotransferase class V-fold PLP-dependent enzyme [Sandarakinorhabdus sp.]
MKSRIYLDHAATTPVGDAARAAVIDALAVIGNPSSVHGGGRAAHALLEGARDAVAGFAGVAAENLVFTSGGTEAIALAANGARLAGPVRPRLLVGATEHSAVLQARDDAQLLPVDGNGLIDLQALAAALATGPALVAVQAANNETGVIQPLAEVAALVRDTGSLLLVDAVQAAGKMVMADADFVALSAHKLGGPPGVGALIVRDPQGLIAVQHGGGQERGHRGGTPNLPGIAGFAAAVAEARDWRAVAARRDKLEAQLKAGGAIIHGENAPRLPNISSIGLPGVAAATQVMMLDLEGFMVSAGAACSSGKVKTSHVLHAMGLGAAAGEAIRVSLAATTTDDEIAAFAAAWLAMAARLGRKSTG